VIVIGVGLIEGHRRHGLWMAVASARRQVGNVRSLETHVDYGRGEHSVSTGGYVIYSNES
jgi:hypothetical protein